MNKESHYVMGIVSSPVKQAHHIAHQIVEKHLAACAQISSSIKSIYHWENKIQEDVEVLIYLKTRSDKIKDINLLLTTLHPYDIPEFIVIPIEEGNPKYFTWIDETVS